MIAFWWLSLAKYLSLQNVQHILFYLLILFLPTQLGKHFWPSWSFVYGQRIDYLSPTLYVTDVLAILLFMASLLKRELVMSKKFLFIILFLSFSIYFSKSPFAGWYFLLKFLEMSFVAWLVLRQTQKVNKEILSLLFSIGVILESILAAAQFFLHRSVGGLLYFLGERTFNADTPGIANASIHGTLVLRPYGTFSHPNVLAGFLLLGMLLVWYFSSNRVKQSRKIEIFGFTLFVRTMVYASLIIGSLGLLLTLSRTTILFGGLVLLIVLFKHFYKKAIFVIFLIILCLILFPTLFYRFAPSTFEESARQRLQLFSAAWHMLIHAPLFGVGLGNFISSLPSSVLLQPVHNIFVLWTTETGILGGAIMLLFISGIGKGLFEKWKKSSDKARRLHFPLGLLGASIIILGMFDHYFLTLQQGQLLLAFVSGLFLASLKTTRK